MSRVCRMKFKTNLTLDENYEQFIYDKIIEIQVIIICNSNLIHYKFIKKI